MSIETILIGIGALIVGGGIGFLIKFLLDKSLVTEIAREKAGLQKTIDQQVLIVKTEQQREKDSWNVERLQLQKDKADALESLRKIQDELTKTKGQLEDAKAGFESSLAALKLTNLYDQININIRAKLDQLDRSLSTDGQASELTLKLIQQIIEDINSKNLTYNKGGKTTSSRKKADK